MVLCPRRARVRHPSLSPACACACACACAYACACACACACTCACACVAGRAALAALDNVLTAQNIERIRLVNAKEIDASLSSLNTYLVEVWRSL